MASISILLAVDGVALKVTVDRWAAASGEARSLAYEAALALRQIEIGLAAFVGVLSGLTLIAFGRASLRSTRYPAWLGAIGLLDGLGMAEAGAAQAAMGFSGLAMTLSMLSSSVLILWMALVGVLMWRWASRLDGDSDGAAM